MNSDESNEEHATVLPLGVNEAAPSGAPVVGWLVRHDAAAGPEVDWPGNPHGPTLARSTVSLPEATAVEAMQSRRGVVLLFERDRADLPIIVGLLVEGPSVPVQLEASPAVDAEIDGQRVSLEGRDEIVLRCGKASITMRRNGRVIIRGTYVESRSGGTNRIKGGSVQIN